MEFLKDRIQKLDREKTRMFIDVRRLEEVQKRVKSGNNTSDGIDNVNINVEGEETVRTKWMRMIDRYR